MDLFYRTHNNLLDSLKGVIDRQLNYEIDWNHPLIGIKGSRGVGKTMFLLAYAKRMEENYGRSCLYVNLNNFYFTKRRIYSFADEFFKRGGKILILDQINKYHYRIAIKWPFNLVLITWLVKIWLAAGRISLVAACSMINISEKSLGDKKLAAGQEWPLFLGGCQLKGSFDCTFNFFNINCRFTNA